ncbi:MAG: cation diffusion facilitator family transporter [Actinomycetota bacterium]
MASPGHSNKAVIAALLANGVIAISKFIVFLITGAASLLAESIHSVADTGNQGLLLYGGKAARRPPDEEHPFGYGNRRYFWAFIVALILFSMGGLFAIYEGIEKLRHPHELESVGLAIALLSFAIVVEGVSFRTAIVEANKVRGDRTWMQFIRRSKAPELPVVLLEDAGALCGLVVALFGVTMAEVTDEARWDAAGSLGIGVLLVVIAVFLAGEMSSLLLGEAATTEDVAAMRRAIEEHDSVQRVIHLRTEHIGPEEIVVAAKLEFDHALSFPQLAGEINGVEARIRAAVPSARLIFVEPDVYRE